MSQLLEVNGSLIMILAASAIELTAASINCDNLAKVNMCSNEAAYAVAVGCVSVVCVLLQLILNRAAKNAAPKVEPWMSVFLIIWWIPGASVLTFRSPFVVAGNGYFASWAAVLFAGNFFRLSGLRKLFPSGVTGVTEALNAPPQNQGPVG
uniref:Uncharacterized protein n=1 Tax=Chromera velia CCMP2878 TaxID=1169474 RepID=A0A0G4I317_9ALVE|mmetsp:Transcript_49429/g.97364  ORF Transcript_49429/g.97364 Transcript_49429/m.97364 type:complete len:151 (-) Transcript_49429:42-494(-)|eukprot:Cvel_10553.t1-p1 / transcript=Cvel_10553.t1 / gene=Cvel_10553 / organism=Chromera_velia_CCMP2878 / gene_product=hypothetical protein / transcript_product=hypothetical protein / location=Cvel_scaffold639:19252-20863(+) / protein_length=150 / sequence_SO=supercontig / SO=protein_coding / is_pseudo=false